MLQRSPTFEEIVEQVRCSTPEEGVNLIRKYVAEQNAAACGERDDLLAQLGQLEAHALGQAKWYNVEITELKALLETHRGCPRFGAADEALIQKYDFFGQPFEAPVGHTLICRVANDSARAAVNVIQAHTGKEVSPYECMRLVRSIGTAVEWNASRELRITLQEIAK